MPFALSAEQMDIFNRLESTSKNYFLTGKAGTGKSTIIRYFLENTKKRCVVVAPTGLAAINARGATIHSFFNLGVGVQQTELYRGDGLRSEMYRALDTIVIDEVSMVRVDYMDMIDSILKKARKNSAPFGGCQIVAVGDLYQLPPFGDNEDVERFLYEKYHSLFFFKAPVFRENPIEIIELEEVHRQKDPVFKDILNSIREGNATPEMLHEINKRRIDPPKDINCVTLVTSNIAVNQINEENLAALPGEPRIYHGSVQGEFNKRELPTDEELTLKLGAKVLFIKNGPSWVNGTMGTITELDENHIHVQLEDSGIIVDVEEAEWDNITYCYDRVTGTIHKEIIGSFYQYPIKLAYAITIHKSQGKTFSNVQLDYTSSGAFAAGQTYVGLSRCTSLEGLYLKKELRDYDIRVNQEVISFMHGRAATAQENCIQVTWNTDKTVSVPPIDNPKLITGRRLLSVLGANRYETPFAAWCAMMRVYEPPFKDNQFTRAGRIVEEKQYQYIAERIKQGKKNLTILSPDEYFGPDAKSATGFNFFDDEIFGGMWDYLLMEGNNVSAVFEMKTMREAKRTIADEKQKVDEASWQASLYAHLLGVNSYMVVLSYLKDEDYDSPENYICTPENTIIKKRKVGSDFRRKALPAAKAWWEAHILSGKSPEYDEMKDHDILIELRNM